MNSHWREQSLVQTCRCFLTYCKTAKRSAYVYKNNENMQWILQVCWKTSALNTQVVFVKVFSSYVSITIRQIKAVLQVFLLKEQQQYEAAWLHKSVSLFYYSWYCIIKHLPDLALSVTMHVVYKAALPSFSSW